MCARVLRMYMFNVYVGVSMRVLCVCVCVCAVCTYSREYSDVLRVMHTDE